MQTLHNDAVTGLQPLLDDPLIALPARRLHLPHFNLVFSPDDKHDGPPRALLHGPLRHQNRAGLECALKPNPHELSRQ